MNRHISIIFAAMLLAPLAALHAADAIPVLPPSNDPKAPVSLDADKDSKAVPLERMKQVYEEVKTPFKYGVVIRGEANQLVDSPSVFRKDGQWYMVYVTITGSVGYETCLARSADLLKWEKLGIILSFRPDGWDRWQRAGYLALSDTTWGGSNELETYDGKYWMSFLGGALQGYETDPLAIGLVWTKTPTEAREWTPLAENPVLHRDQPDVRPFEKVTLYKSNIIWDKAETLGSPFVMFYNGKIKDGYEKIGMAVSDDMVHWKRYGKDSVVANGEDKQNGITGDPQVVKIGDLWVMFYFGAFWRPGAFDTFACSTDLVHWTKWTRPDLVQSSEPWDRQFAHKPWMVKHDGVVYHFYCAVGDQGRVIALATSKDLRDESNVDAPMGVERVARPATQNYSSPAVTNDDTVCWIQVDLGRSLPIDQVKLFPIVEWGWLYAAEDKRKFFPVRFNIEASDDAEFKSASIITDQTAADYTTIPDAVVIFPGNRTTGRYVRLTATRLSDKQMALMKVEVWSGGTNVAEGCPVADSFKGNLGVTNLTLKRRPQDDVVTDNPGNVIPADQWKPVAYKAQAPLGGVHLADGLFKTAMQNNIAYLMNTFTVDEMVRDFRNRAGKPNPEGMREPEAFWDTGLAGQNAGRFLMGAGNTLRWIEDPALRKRMNDIVDVIEECRQPDGYIMAFPANNICECERAGYTRAWVTHGLIEAGYAGNPKAFPLLRGFYDWFNQCPYLPELLRRPNQSQQGTVANTRLYFTPIGKAEDLQVVQRYFQENYWLDQLAKRDTDAIWKYPYDRPHCYLLTAIEPYLDLYRATGKRHYLEAAMGGWDLYHDNWEHIGGSIAICEGGSYPPKSYIFRCTGELCGSVFMARLSQRFHLLDPEQEKYVGEIEKAIYNITLPNQMGDEVIVYHARMVGRKDEQPNKIGTCCEGQGTRMIGSIPEYIYSIAPDGLYVDLFAPSEITWQQDKQTIKVQMITGFPFDNNVALRFSLATPVAAKVRVRVPAWSSKPMALLVNNTLEVTGVPGTYATLERTWKEGDRITFTLPAELRMTQYEGKEASETQPRYALEYGPILLAAVGVGADRAEASFDCGSASLLSRIKPVAGQPLHFSIEGESNYNFIPYWEVASKQTFTCFPIVTEK